MSHSGSRPEVQSYNQSISKACFLSVVIETCIYSLTVKWMCYIICFDLSCSMPPILERVARRKGRTSVFITLGEYLTLHIYRTNHVRVILIWTIDLVPFCTWSGRWKGCICVPIASARWDESRLKQPHYYVTGWVCKSEVKASSAGSGHKGYGTR